MMIEMNLGVVCGCLFGVQPFLATLLPRLFVRSYPSDPYPSSSVRRQESSQPDSQRSFQAYPLTDLPGRMRTTPLAEVDAFEALWTPEGTGSNYASASSDGRKRGELLTPGVITVQKEFTISEEVTPCQSPASEFDRQLHFLGDLGSEDWTLEEVCIKD